VAGTFGADQDKFSNVILRTSNLSGNYWYSSNGSRGPTILFSNYNFGYTYINGSPETLYNVSIPSNFLKMVTLSLNLYLI
jgi:hypothetical protein